MNGFRNQPPSYWVLLGAFAVVGLFWASDLIFDWAPKWLQMIAILTALTSSVFTFRVMWRLSDSAAFHPDGGRE